jgi:hypothetical protein
LPFAVVQTRKRRSLAQKIRYDLKKVVQTLNETPKAVIKRSKRIFVEPIYGTTPETDINVSENQETDENDHDNQGEYEEVHSSEKYASSQEKMEVGTNEKELDEDQSNHVEIFHVGNTLRPIGTSSKTFHQ